MHKKFFFALFSLAIFAHSAAAEVADCTIEAMEAPVGRAVHAWIRAYAQNHGFDLLGDSAEISEFAAIGECRQADGTRSNCGYIHAQVKTVNGNLLQLVSVNEEGAPRPLIMTTPEIKYAYDAEGAVIARRCEQSDAGYLRNLEILRMAILNRDTLYVLPGSIVPPGNLQVKEAMSLEDESYIARHE